MHSFARTQLNTDRMVGFTFQKFFLGNLPRSFYSSCRQFATYETDITLRTHCLLPPASAVAANQYFHCEARASLFSNPACVSFRQLE